MSRRVRHLPVESACVEKEHASYFQPRVLTLSPHQDMLLCAILGVLNLNPGAAVSALVVAALRNHAGLPDRTLHAAVAHVPVCAA